MSNPPKSNLSKGSPQPPVRPVRPLDTTDVVLTPGGLRPRSLVYRLQPGEHVSLKGGRVQIIETATGNLVKDLGESATTSGETEEGPPSAASGAAPGIPDSGWIEHAQWHNGDTENPIVYFSTKWVVPSAPLSTDGQRFYLFNGLQPGDASHILQPVLQWGPGSDDGGGNYWEITNWYATTLHGPAVYQPPIQVNTGDVLQGVMTCTGEEGIGLNYVSSFVGYPAVDLTITEAPELTWAYETFEGYNFNQCSDYPNAPFTAMYDIEIRRGIAGSAGTEATLSWFPVTTFTDCGQKCVIVSDSSPGGAIYFFYRTMSAADSLVSAVSRSPNFLDIFCVGTDYGVYTAAWEPSFTGWEGWSRIGNFVAAPGTSVYGVSRAPNFLDIFAVGTDFGVYTAAWEPGFTEWTAWSRIGDLTVGASSSVFPISRSLNHLDIFAVGSDQGTYTASWQPGDTAWQGWWRIQEGSAAPGTTIFGVSRNPDYLDIFCVGTEYGIYTASWQPGFTSWQGWYPVQNGLAAPGTSVTAVSRSLGFLDIFAVGADRGIYTASWQPSFTGWQGWERIGNFVSSTEASVFGVSRSPNFLDIFAVGEDHGVYNAAWEPTFTAWQGWSRIGTYVTAPGESALCVSRSLNLLDIFAVGTDLGIYTASWQPGDKAWLGWWQILTGKSA